VSTVELVDQNKGALSIDRLCNLVGITTSGYYKAKRRGQSKRQRDDERLCTKVRAMFKLHKGRYGSPRLARALRSMDETVGRLRIPRIAITHSRASRSPIPGMAIT